MSRTREPKTIAELVKDPENRRKHSARNIGMVTTAIKDIGTGRSIVIDEKNVILAGNATIDGAAAAGVRKLRIVDAEGDEIIAVRRTGMSKEEKRRLAMYDNRAGELAEWDSSQLAADFAAGLDLKPFFSDEELKSEIRNAGGKVGKTDPDAIPELRRTSIATGDLFELGSHRLLCGDTTDPANIARITSGLPAMSMLHSDPPYGMGKESDGIANDNLYEEKLDAFQMQWFAAWSARLAENGSFYIWGLAPDLWRLWYRGGLNQPDLVMRNEIVWNKGDGMGMNAPRHSYATATERCIFVMRGQQFLGNQNKADYFEGYEPLRVWLCEQRDKAGWKNGDVNRITATSMAMHWFTKSQFTPITKKQYDRLAAAAAGRSFIESYDDVMKRFAPREVSAAMRETRSHFDNQHDTMTDVWTFPRVTGEERFGHATPKPVVMVARAIKSSSKQGDTVGVPFGGTAPEIIAAEQFGRRAVIIEMEPTYCQSIVDRWEAFTGQKAKKVAASRKRAS